MRKIGLLLAAASALSITASVSAKTIALWHFDEGVVSNNAVTLSSEYNPEIMVATAGTNDNGTLPYFTENIGLDYLTEGMNGTVISTNKCSLKFTNSGLPEMNSSKGGVLTIPYNEIMVLSNLTVEVFVKVDRLVNYPLIIGIVRSGGNTSWNIDMDNTGKPRLRIDSNPTGVSGGTTPGWNESTTSSVAINDGMWHHLAFTYTHATKKALLYVDYQQRAETTTTFPLVYEMMQMRVGQGCGGRAFDGWLDEIRISDEVLQPNQFLMAPRPVSDTYCYWDFDGPAGTYADILTNRVYTNPFINLMHGTAGTSGTGAIKPMFTNELPSTVQTFIRDGIDGELIKSNSTALFFRNSDTNTVPLSKIGGIVRITKPFVPEFPTNFTVEAFVKADRAAKWPQIIGKRRSNGGDFSWSLGVDPPSNEYRCRFDTNPEPGTSNPPGFNQVLRSGVMIYDGNWHHIAMSYYTPTKTIKLYVDHKLKATAVTVFPMYLDDGGIEIGAGDQAFDGAIDEVRITKRVLEPEEFLYLADPPPPLYPLGTIFIVR